MTYCINIKEQITPVHNRGMSNRKNISIHRCKDCLMLFGSTFSKWTKRNKYNKCVLCRIEQDLYLKEYIENTFKNRKVENFEDLKKVFIEKHKDLEQKRSNELKAKGVIVKNPPICTRL